MNAQELVLNWNLAISVSAMMRLVSDGFHGSCSGTNRFRSFGSDHEMRDEYRLTCCFRLPAIEC